MITAAELANLLGRHEHEFAVRTSTENAGFIALGQRTDIAATFYSLKIFPESVRAAFEDNAVSGAVSGKFHLITHQDEAYGQTLRLHVELRAGATADEALAPRLAELVVASLLRTNGEYRQLHQALGRRADPVITLHQFGTDGFAHGIKHRWAWRTLMIEVLDPVADRPRIDSLLDPAAGITLVDAWKSALPELASLDSPHLSPGTADSKASPVSISPPSGRKPPSRRRAGTCCSHGGARSSGFPTLTCSPGSGQRGIAT